MPKMKQMVKRTDVEIAKARRTCKFTKAPISKGEPCLVLYEAARDRYCYSANTAIEMIKMARARLDDLEHQLADNSRSSTS